MADIININNAIFTKDANNMIDGLLYTINEYYDIKAQFEKHKICDIKNNISNFDELEFIRKISKITNKYYIKTKRLSKQIKSLQDHLEKQEE